MAEIEQVYEGEVVDDGTPGWETLVSEWTSGAAQALVGKLRQARAAANVSRHYGQASMEKFAAEVACGKSKVYDYARVWWIFGHLMTPNADNAFSGRLESGRLSMTQLVELTYAPDPVSSLDVAEDEGLSSRAIRERSKEERRVMEEREASMGSTPHRPVEVTTEVCPDCTGGGLCALCGQGVCQKCQGDGVLPDLLLVDKDEPV